MIDGQRTYNYYEDVKNQHIAFVFIGQSAAGKSTIANPISRKYGARIYDSDFVKEWTDEFDGGYGANRVHKESKVVAFGELDAAGDNGTNIVLPIVGAEYGKVNDAVSLLTEKGYTVQLILNELPEEKAAKRAITRFFTDGRFVNPVYVLRQGNRPTESYKKAKEEDIAHGYQWFSNDVAFGEDPKLIEQSFLDGTIPRGYRADHEGSRSDGIGSLAGSPSEVEGENAAGQGGLSEPADQRSALEQMFGRSEGGTTVQYATPSESWEEMLAKYGAQQQSENAPSGGPYPSTPLLP